jgi:hypothetical protein
MLLPKHTQTAVGPPIHHFDLYRLDPQQDMSRLDLTASLSSAVSLIEWAERMPQQLLPRQRLEVSISILDEAGSSSSSSSAGTEQQQQQQQQHGLAMEQLHLHDAVLLPTPDLQLQQQQQVDSLLDLESIQDTGEEDYDEAEDEYEDLFTDKRQRLIHLKAYGESWAARLQQLAQDMQQSSSETLTS